VPKLVALKNAAPQRNFEISSHYKLAEVINHLRKNKQLIEDLPEAADYV